ncbi:response regulator [Shewanella surugensis]|uniref:Response regulator n=1 Tax=Shewanella surugensis TaxID=212020 RepID=A0ABT0L6K7_9GAMM|nr:response regulator [Shewanella surugensis]MCL1123025.1 response regulator [Shewanella surugensis]
MPFPVLICDDFALARKQIVRSLPPQWDIDVTHAVNGLEAIEAIRQGKGALVFLDLNMPVMNGFEVLEKIQSEKIVCQIIVVSADIQINALMRVKALGALDFIQKPVNPESLKHILDEHNLFRVHRTHIPPLPDIFPLSLLDACKELANVAMGRAAALLSTLLDVFVILPIPNVNTLEVSELIMALKSTDEQESISALCQGFIGAGIAGEALLLFHDSSFKDMAALMDLPSPPDQHAEVEIMIDIGNVLIGAFLNGLSEQLDMTFSQNHPVILGRHCNANDLIQENSDKWTRSLAMEINYRIEHHDIQCDLLLVLTEDSLPTLTSKLAHFIDRNTASHDK